MMTFKQHVVNPGVRSIFLEFHFTAEKVSKWAICSFKKADRMVLEVNRNWHQSLSWKYLNTPQRKKPPSDGDQTEKLYSILESGP